MHANPRSCITFGMDTTTQPAGEAQAQGRYFVKCDECRETMRFTDSVPESAAGGVCPACRAAISARMAKVARKRTGARPCSFEKPCSAECATHSWYGCRKVLATGSR